MDDQFGLDAVRIRREALHRAMVDLEAALSTPVADGRRWQERVVAALVAASGLLEEHIREVEADDGFLRQVAQDVPRLTHQVHALEGEHVTLRAEVERLRLEVAALDAAEVVTRIDDLRTEVLRFVGQLSLHRQRGSDLIFEAYQQDLGDSG